MTLVSMTSMKVGSMTVSATIHLFTLGFSSCCDVMVSWKAAMKPSRVFDNELRAAALGDIHCDVKGCTDSQWMVCRRRPVQFDLHRDSLHDFNPVAGGVLGGMSEKAAPVPARIPTTLPLYSYPG